MTTRSGQKMFKVNIEWSEVVFAWTRCRRPKQGTSFGSSLFVHSRKWLVEWSSGQWVVKLVLIVHEWSRLNFSIEEPTTDQNRQSRSSTIKGVTTWSGWNKFRGNLKWSKVLFYSIKWSETEARYINRKPVVGSFEKISRVVKWSTSGFKWSRVVQITFLRGKSQ